MIKNLNQLRRTLREGTQLEILDHCRPECIGYSIVKRIA